MSSELGDVYVGPDIGVRSERRNHNHPWDETYQAYPFQQSAYDFWEYDARREMGDAQPYNNNRHVPGSMQADEYQDINAWDGGRKNAYFFSQEKDHSFKNLGTRDQVRADNNESHHHATGGKGHRTNTKTWPSTKNYCGDLPAIHGPYEEQCYDIDELIAGYNCTKFMPSNEPSGVYHQEVSEEESSSNLWSEIKEILLIAGIITITAFIIMLLF